jgi:hypothetical protein
LDGERRRELRELAGSPGQPGRLVRGADTRERPDAGKQQELAWRGDAASRHGDRTNRRRELPAGQARRQRRHAARCTPSRSINSSSTRCRPRPTSSRSTS